MFGDLLYRQPGLSVKIFPSRIFSDILVRRPAIARRIGKGAQLMKQIVAGIVAHVDAGKTTLSEALLYRTGEIRKIGASRSRRCVSGHQFLGEGARHHDLRAPSVG